MDYEPPFLDTYKTLLQQNIEDSKHEFSCSIETIELPMIDVGRLNLEHTEREECLKEITEAAKEWGFFQIVNHGISHELLEKMHSEQMKVFYESFVNKSTEAVFGLSSQTYRWGNSSVTNLKQLSWSEAFHFSMANISNMEHHQNLRECIEAYARTVSNLAQSLAEILGEKVNIKSSYFKENCLIESCSIRLNRYPVCPYSSKVYGLVPHSDTSFLTIVHQDQVGGLELFKNGIWVAVKPNPQALVVNIGDLFQAMSNDVYKSLKHRVVAAEKVERISTAFFYIPYEEAMIQSNNYREFSLKEYIHQNEEDVKQTGNKVGLSRFLI